MTVLQILMYKVLGDVEGRHDEHGADPYSNILYIQGTKDKIQGPRVQSVNNLFSPVGI